MLQKKTFTAQTQEPINTYEKKDKEQQLIKHLKSGRSEKAPELKKSNKKLLSFTDSEVKQIEKVQKLLELKTFNATIYKLTELGLENFNISKT